MANKLIFAKVVRKQLQAIGQYTQKEWGINQRDKYLAMIFAAFETLQKAPLTGIPCDEIDKNLRKLHVGRHVIYYYQRKKSIEIAGILHDVMLPSLHISKQ